MTFRFLQNTDPEIMQAVNQELTRQRNSIILIASENYASTSVMEVQGTVLTNKYAEGYPNKRYYGGCEIVDKIENIAIERACELFYAKHANVQPHSGSQANQAAYAALMEPGDKFMGMNLSEGGHLTHGSPVSFSGKLYKAVHYGINPETELLDMDMIREQALRERPKVIVAGASAYPRIIDFKAFADIAHEVGAYLMVDMAHIAGLVAAGCHPSPVPYADIVTSTSQKTLRGPRGGFMVCNDDEIATKYNKALFPGSQGGPLENTIAAKAVAFKEAQLPAYKTYANQVLENSKAMGEAMVEGGLRLVSGGTDNHLCLVDLTASDLTGKDAESLLETVGICVNKNTIPNEQRSPFVTSGIRVGAAAITTRGFDTYEARFVGEMIAKAIFNPNNEDILRDIRARVKQMLDNHPLYTALDC